MNVNLNSMLYWWPRIVKLDVPKPVTVLITIEDVVEDILRCTLSEGTDNDACNTAREKVKALASLLDEAVKSYIGGYPVFMRSDYTSCKHYVAVSGRPLYRVDSPEDFIRHVYILVGECHEYLPVRGLFGAPRPNAVALREWLNIVKWTNNLPEFYGNVEVRVFTKNGRVVKVYPYYHRSGLEEHLLRRVSSPNTVLKEYTEKYVSEIISGIKEIKAYAEKIVAVDGIKEYDWSIDFALVNKDGNRVWYFIDMALADASWKPRTETDEDKLIEEALSLA